jgi:DNA repair protein RecO (recombination protein O)
VISHYRKLECFIIKRKNYKEADKVITIFSKEKGKIILIAKGIRKISSKRAASLELFNHVQMEVAKTPGMDVITEVKLLESYQSFSQSIAKANIAYRIVELIDKLIPEKEENPQVYELLIKAFKYIKQTEITKENIDKIAVRFKLRILNLLGFGTPPSNNLEEISRYIEDIVQKKLVSGNHLHLD